MYFGVVFVEHVLFRRGQFSNYKPDDYTNWRKLPFGVAALGALAAGWTGAALGTFWSSVCTSRGLISRNVNFVVHRTYRQAYRTRR